MIKKFSKEDYRDFLEGRAQNPEAIFIKKVIEYIKEDFQNDEFGTSQLASKMNLSESQLYRKIKATTDRSTAVFIRSIRLNEAKKMIQSTDKTIAEIAYAVGFNEPTWFSTAFKKEFGYSPSTINRA